MGKTGIASVSFLVKQGQRVIHIMDNRPNPPGLKVLKQEFPNISYTINHFDQGKLLQADEIIISPGLSRQEPVIVAAIKQGIPVISEIELFSRYVNAPVVAITGSNGKSTVTTLLGAMAKQAGWKTQVGGNLGTPAIELICTPAPDIYILELSSFQLESTYSLQTKAAVVLNISEDHQDRYDNLAGYITAKQRIFNGAENVLLNNDDAYVLKMLPANQPYLSFGINTGNYRITKHQGQDYLSRVSEPNILPLVPVKSMRLQGQIACKNALAALALGEIIGLPQIAMLETLATFSGLAHRCAWVANYQGIDFFNDSKATNVGATIAAITNLGKKGHIIIILGGEAKGADFAPLAEVAKEYCRASILIGKDASIIAKTLAGLMPLYNVETMHQAVEKATKIAKPGEAVLLSPACASFDMFDNYEHRGQVFEKSVQQLIEQNG